MKIFNRSNKLPTKSWSINLEEDTLGNVIIEAVDTHTGKHLVPLIVFTRQGGVNCVVGVKQTLRSLGYSDREHGNCFNAEGSLDIKED